MSCFLSCVIETVWDRPIRSAYYRAQTPDQALNAGTSLAYIDDQNGTVNYALSASGPGSIKTLTPIDPTGATTLAQLFPIRWEPNALYKATVYIRSDGETEGSNPVDVIRLKMQAATNAKDSDAPQAPELAQSHDSTRGYLVTATATPTITPTATPTPHPLDRAASPRILEPGGAAQAYTVAQKFLEQALGRPQETSVEGSICGHS